jgi:hypothetical protein
LNAKSGFGAVTRVDLSFERVERFALEPVGAGVSEGNLKPVPSHRHEERPDGADHGGAGEGHHGVGQALQAAAALQAGDGVLGELGHFRPPSKQHAEHRYAELRRGRPSASVTAVTPRAAPGASLRHRGGHRPTGLRYLQSGVGEEPAAIA